MEGGLVHLEVGLSHLEKGFESGYEKIEGGIAEHIDKKDDHVDMGIVVQHNLDKVETGLEWSLERGLGPVEDSFQVLFPPSLLPPSALPAPAPLAATSHDTVQKNRGAPCAEDWCHAMRSLLLACSCRAMLSASLTSCLALLQMDTLA